MTTPGHGRFDGPLHRLGPERDFVYVRVPADIADGLERLAESREGETPAERMLEAVLTVLRRGIKELAPPPQAS